MMVGRLRGLEVYQVRYRLAVESVLTDAKIMLGTVRLEPLRIISGSFPV